MQDLNKVFLSPTKNIKNTTKKTGDENETLVATYLQKQGLTVLYRNFHCRQGEIDLICLQPETNTQFPSTNDTLVFVEVRFRRYIGYGDGLESVNYRKQQKIIRTAKFFLCTRPKFADLACRFDVVAVTLRDNKSEIEWIQNAFC